MKILTAYVFCLIQALFLTTLHAGPIAYSINYGPEEGGGPFVTDLGTGLTKRPTIEVDSGEYGALAYKDGTIYSITDTSYSTTNVSTGEINFIYIDPSPNKQYFTGMDFLGNDLMGADNSALFQINIADGSYTEVMSFSGMGFSDVGALAALDDGTMVMTARHQDYDDIGLYSIDLSSNSLSQAGKMLDYFSGMDLGPDGILYGILDSDLGIYSINPEDASYSLLRYLEFPGIDGGGDQYQILRGLAIIGDVTSVPEPGTFVLILLGLACLLFCTRARLRATAGGFRFVPTCP